MRGYSFDVLLISLGRSRIAKKRNTSAAGIGYKRKIRHCQFKNQVKLWRKTQQLFFQESMVSV